MAGDMGFKGAKAGVCVATGRKSRVLSATPRPPRIRILTLGNRLLFITG